jgi:PIN domain nuclease of toxin-antitoxin system
LILLDTHALLWWALDPAHLSAKAAAVLEEMEKRGGFASAISIWELGVKMQRGKLAMGLGIEEFARRVEQSATVELVPVDTTIWLRSLALPWGHRDPADRVIVATALIKGVPLLTRDARRRCGRGRVGILPLRRNDGPARRINEIVHGTRAVSADMALRLARFFGTSDRFWLNLQTAYDLDVERDRLGDRLEREVAIHRMRDLRTDA